MSDTKQVPARHLPVRPNLDQLKHQAKDLLGVIRRGDPAAIAEFKQHYPKPVWLEKAKLAAWRPPEKLSGRSIRDLLSSAALTSEESVCRRANSAVTCTESVSDPTSSFASMRITSDTGRLIPVRTSFLKPWASKASS